MSATSQLLYRYENPNFKSVYLDSNNFDKNGKLPNALNPFLITTTICQPCIEIRQEDKYALRKH